MTFKELYEVTPIIGLRCRTVRHMNCVCYIFMYATYSVFVPLNVFSRTK